MKKVIYTLLVIFILYTLYKIVLIYVLNVSSLKSSYIHHSKSVTASKDKGLFISSYRLDTLGTGYNRVKARVPAEIFVEKEKVIYPQYYFYWGKSEIGKRSTVDLSGLLELSKSDSYDIRCLESTLPNEKENVDICRKNLYFFFDNVPATISFFITDRGSGSPTDTIVYKRIYN